MNWRRLILVLMVLVTLIPTTGAIADPPPDVHWVRFFGMDQPTYGYINKMLIDTLGNVVVAGYRYDVEGLSTFDSDGAAVSYDEDGDEMWRYVFDGPMHSNDDFSDAVIDGSGRIVLVGTACGSSFYTYPCLDSQALIVWLEPDGQEYQVRLEPIDTGFSTAARVVAAPDGGVVVVGWKDPVGETTIRRLWKFDGNGDLVWTSDVPDIHPSEWLDVEVSHAGTIVMAGADNGPPENDWVTVALDENGTLLWSRTYESAEQQDDFPVRLSTASGDGVIVLGMSGATIALQKYGFDGTLLWSFVLDDSGDGEFEYPSNLLEMPDGQIAVLAGLQPEDTPRDILNLMLDRDGQLLWRESLDQFGSTDWGSGLAYSGDDLLMAGHAYDYERGNYDFLLFDRDTGGSLNWSTTFDGLAGLDDVWTHVVIAPGNAPVIAGTSCWEELYTGDCVWGVWMIVRYRPIPDDSDDDTSSDDDVTDDDTADDDAVPDDDSAPDDDALSDDDVSSGDDDEENDDEVPSEDDGDTSPNENADLCGC